MEKSLYSVSKPSENHNIREINIKERDQLLRQTLPSRILPSNRAKSYQRRVELLRNRGERTTERLTSLVSRMNDQVVYF